MLTVHTSTTCAVGDIHGDLAKAITLFKLAGVVEEVDRRLVWTGGNTTIVQLGDVLDRGAQEIGEHLEIRDARLAGCFRRCIHAVCGTAVAY